MPYSIGLQAASVAFISTGLEIHFTVAVIICLALILAISGLEKESADAPKRLPGYSLFHILPFFHKRHDFFNWGFHATGTNAFQFQLLRNTVVVVSGGKGRHSFFTAKGLNLTEGFKVLSGAIPQVPRVTSDLTLDRTALIHKRLADLQRNAPLSSLLPHLLEDIRRMMESWGSSGKFDPFNQVYELAFQLTCRTFTCSEISDHPAIVARLKYLYNTLEVGTTPATVLVPWFPTPAMIRKVLATREIYEIVKRAMKTREDSGIAQNDTLQLLLDAGDKVVAFGFIIGLLIAGAKATGTTASWLMTYLGGSPEWRAKAVAEVESLLASYPLESPSTPCAPLSTRLGAIPLEAWENDMPVLDGVIRETTRLAQPHSSLRRNIGPEFCINDKIIPEGAYVLYPFSDVHLDPELYPDPWKFDPARKQVTHAPLGHVGWGAGKHPCLGTRVAKIELKLVAAMFVLGFKHSVIDCTGEPANPMPVPNWNDKLFARPPGRSFNLKYERTNVPL